MRLTNTTRAPIELVVKGEAKNGAPPTEVIAAGETKTLNVDLKRNAKLRANLALGHLVEAAAQPRAASANSD